MCGCRLEAMAAIETVIAALAEGVCCLKTESMEATKKFSEPPQKTEHLELVLFSVCSSDKLFPSSKFILHDVCQLSSMVTHMNSKRKS
ncbi:hypothetical protein LguiA_006761 [Lonicera macranthoides]